MKKQLIACAVTLTVAATASANDITEAMRGLLTDLGNVEISQTGTADVYNGISDAASRLGGATAQDASDAGKIVFEQTLQPSYQEITEPAAQAAWSGTKAVGNYIINELPGDVSSAVTNVGVSLQLTGIAAGDLASATGQDVTDAANADISQTGTADVVNGVSESNSVAQTGASAASASEFSSDPMEKIEEQKARNRAARVKKEGKMALQRASFYGVDTDKGMEEFVAYGYYTAAEAGLEVNDEEALAIGIFYSYSL